MRYHILDDELAEKICSASPEEQSDWIFLSVSDEFPGFWVADGIDSEFFYDFEELLGRYRLVAPSRINALLLEAEALGYHLAFVEDPTLILEDYERLKALPPVDLSGNDSTGDTGYYPWQIIGFNKLVRSDIPAGLAIWDTGTGKTALIAAAIKWRLEQGDIDLALVVVKAHNKADMKAKLKTLAGVDSVIVTGDEERRWEIYQEIDGQIHEGHPTVVVMNYEKFRTDESALWSLVDKRRVLFFWDEMPTKLSNRSTQLYESVKRTLYKSFTSKPRPKWMRHLVLTATPVEGDPEGFYSYLNLVHPRMLGTVADFRNEHVTAYNWISGKPERWENLDRIEAKVDHITSRVSKADPDVAKMFPEVIRDEVLIDWNPKHRLVYDRFTSACKDILQEEKDSGINVLSMIQVMQMICDAPSMVRESARNRELFSALLSASEDEDGGFLPLSGPSGSEAAVRLLELVDSSQLTDVGHTKLEKMREIIQEKHPMEKVVVHSTWAGYIFPVWTHWLDEWGISYVTYTGTDKQKQAALDEFRSGSDIQVFLSGDAGSDSIDIPQAKVGISYNGSWKWTTMKQREGRRDRVNSTFDTIYTYDLAMPNSVEDRKRAIRNLKQSYHDAIFEGRAVEGALSARLSQDDLLSILLGEDLDID